MQRHAVEIYFPGEDSDAEKPGAGGFRLPGHQIKPIMNQYHTLGGK